MDSLRFSLRKCVFKVDFFVCPWSFVVFQKVLEHW
jgi:hypothetical protein